MWCIEHNCLSDEHKTNPLVIVMILVSTYLDRNSRLGINRTGWQVNELTFRYCVGGMNITVKINHFLWNGTV